MSKTVYVVEALRTPIGSFQGGLASMPAPKLGAAAISAVLKNSKVSPTQIDECIMGQVLTAGVGQAPARQAAIFAGLPESVPCATVNKVCGSGLKSIMLASDSIKLGYSHLVIAGGQENMTLAPHLMENSRTGYRMGPVTIADSMVKDGLWDVYNNFHMGVAAELCAKEYKFTREAQDTFAQESYKKAQAAQVNGSFKREITPIQVVSGKTTTLVEVDEEPNRANFAKMLTLKPAFDKEGTITAANASKINDAAAAVLLASEEKVKELNMKPLGKILAYASYSHEPKWFTTAPVGAIKKALAMANLNSNDIDLWEINEAFSVVTMAAMQEFSIAADKVNIHGGAVALGHPIGASGARIFTTLIHALHTKNKHLGLATLCIGGGEGIALIVERM